MFAERVFSFHPLVVVGVLTDPCKVGLLVSVVVVSNVAWDEAEPEYIVSHGCHTHSQIDLNYHTLTHKIQTSCNQCQKWKIYCQTYCNMQSLFLVYVHSIKTYMKWDTNQISQFWIFPPFPASWWTAKKETKWHLFCKTIKRVISAP